MSERGNKQAATYVGLAIVLCVGSVVLRKASWQGSRDLHTIMEAIATIFASLARKHQGAGLGLAESSGPGQGSTFTVTLPLEGPVGDQVEAQSHQSGTSALPAA